MNAWVERDSRKRFKKRFLSLTGFTLFELIIAIVLFTVVLLAASGLLINFGSFASRFIRNEASLMGTALGAFEEMTGRITEANEVTIPATSFAAPSIDIRVSPPGPASFDHSGDIFHTYWQTGTQIKYKTSTGSPPAAGGGTVIADDIDASSLSFVRTANRVTVTLDTHMHSGSEAIETNKSRENLSTTAIMRSRNAQ